MSKGKKRNKTSIGRKYKKNIQTCVQNQKELLSDSLYSESLENIDSQTCVQSQKELLSDSLYSRAYNFILIRILIITALVILNKTKEN